MNSEESGVLTMEQARRFLVVSRSTIYKMAGRELPVIRLGRALRVPRAALEKMLENTETAKEVESA